MRMGRAVLSHLAEARSHGDMAVDRADRVDQVDRQAVHDHRLHIIMGMMIAEVSN